MKEFIKRNSYLLIIFGLIIISTISVLSVNGLFDMRVDGQIYSDQIKSFANHTVFQADPIVMLRIFKPLYPILGGTFLHFSDPRLFVLIFNIILYFLLGYAFYKTLTKLGFSNQDSFIGTTWLILGYPLLKYGLSVSVDMAGYTISIITILVGLRAMQKNSYFLFCITSIIGFVGAIAKETGLLGLIIISLFFLIKSIREKLPWSEIVNKLLCLGLPFGILYGAMTWAILGKGPTFLNWYSKNTNEYPYEYHSISKYIFVEGSSFGFLGLYALITLVSKKIKGIGSDKIIFIISAFIATLPVLLWPIVISRVIFVQFIWIIPLAVIFIGKINSRPRKIILAILPVALSIFLFAASSGQSLFSFFS